MMQLKIIVKLEVSNALFKFKSIMLWITNTNGGLFVCLMVFNATFNNISQVNFQKDDDEVCFVLDQHA
jgi:hypothetical protein